jgi:hypothetical protein
LRILSIIISVILSISSSVRGKFHTRSVGDNTSTLDNDLLNRTVLV